VKAVNPNKAERLTLGRTLALTAKPAGFTKAEKPS